MLAVHLQQLHEAVDIERFFALVKAPGFAPWFATVTPLEEVGMLALGSRPARRGLSVESLADLRAIPWVFGWTQMRLMLPGWLGVGTALQAELKRPGGLQRLKRMASVWPFFDDLLGKVEMVCAKRNSISELTAMGSSSL